VLLYLGMSMKKNQTLADWGCVDPSKKKNSDGRSTNKENDVIRCVKVCVYLFIDWEKERSLRKAFVVGYI
jgi:hypothetical protein